MLNNYLEYLKALSQVQGSGHYVNEEIKEVVKVIRTELGLEKRKQDQLNESRKLVFRAKLGGRTSLIQDVLFEAVFGRGERYVDFLISVENEVEIDQAITVIKGMKAPVSISFKKAINGTRLIVVERQ